MTEQTTRVSTDAPTDDQTSSPGEAALPPGTLLCEVFRSPRREGMYLYVEHGEGMARVPENLRERFGAPESALVFRLHEHRRLARASAADVLKALAEHGFYLQMPPVPGGDVSEADAASGGSSAAQCVEPGATTQADREEPSC